MGTTTTLADAFEATPDTRPRQQCSTGLILNRLDDADRATLVAMLTDVTVPHTRIVRALQVVGHRVSGHNVSRHRRSECGCNQ